ncbi:MAG: thioredoxin domain-containing protein [Candidatus Falkowbacteria bacterium]
MAFASRKTIYFFAVGLAVVFGLLTTVYFSNPDHRQFARLDKKSLLVRNKTDEDRLRELNARALAEAATKVPQPVPAMAAADIVAGSRQAPIILIVYYDFSSPFSGRFHEVVKEAIAKYKDSLDVVWRVYPLEGRPEALSAGLAFRCAAGQGSAAVFADRLFGLQRSGQLMIDKYLEAAKAENLDMAKFKICLDNKQYLADIMQAKARAEAAGVTGAPYAFLNGRPLPGAWQFVDFSGPNGQPQEGLGTMIDKLLKNK